MPRVSKYSLNKIQSRNLEEQFFHLVSFLSNTHEIEEFLGEFLTFEEKTMLTKRLMLYVMLSKNMSPTLIHNALHLSRETIRFHQNQFAAKSGLFHKKIKHLMTVEKTKELLNKFEKILKPFDLAVRARNDMKARAQLATIAFNEE